MKLLAIVTSHWVENDYDDGYFYELVNLIDLETYQCIKTVNIPNGYLDSGRSQVLYREPTGLIIEKPYSGNKLPKIGHLEYYKSITKLDEDGEEQEYNQYLSLKECMNLESFEFSDYTHGLKTISTIYKATLKYEIYQEKICFKFDSSKDYFRKSLEDQGIDMTGWCVYKRRKIDYNDFLKSILPKEVINITYVE